MAYKSAMVGPVFVLRWLTVPTLLDLRTLGKELADQRRRVGAQLINLSLIPAEITPPDGEVRREMETFNQVFTEVCSVIHVVVGGTGFKHAVLRSIVSAFALATRRRGLVKVHGSLDDALIEIDAATNDGSGFRGKLNASGLMEGH